MKPMKESDAEALRSLSDESAIQRVSIIEALLRAQADADAILALVKRVGRREDAVVALMRPPFSFSEHEAQQVLDMRFADVLDERRAALRADLVALRDRTD